MHLDPSYNARFGKPGALHHARFMAKCLYYLKLNLLIIKARVALKLSEKVVEEISTMSVYISIFHVPKFLTAEKPDIAAASDLHFIWQMAHFEKTMPAAAGVMKFLYLHQWYLDPTTVVFALANSDETVSSKTKELMAKKLYSLDRPNTYDFDRRNNEGFLPTKDQLLTAEPLCLSDFITAESWLVFEILKHKKSKVKWMLYPPESWRVDPDFLQFQRFVKQIAVVNDVGERAVKAVQETVQQTYSETKLQKMLLVKGKIQKPAGRTKSAYREAAEQLTPAEMLDVAWDLGDFANSQGVQDPSSGSELDVSLDMVPDEAVEEAILQENEDILAAEQID